MLRSSQVPALACLHSDAECACASAAACLCAEVKTGGAGNKAWYNAELAATAAATSARPASSAAYRNSNGQAQGGAQAQAQYRPTSARPQPQQQQHQSPHLQSPHSATSSASAASAGNFTQTRPLQMPVSERPLPSAGLRKSVPYAVEHEEDCICTVCSCGKHACPPTPREAHYDPNMTSEARQSYNGVFSPAKRVGAPDQYKPREGVPFEGESTHKADYRNHGVLPRHTGGPTRGALMDTGVGKSQTPFDDTTTHKSDFPAHPLVARKSGGPRDGNLSTLGPDERDWSTEGRNAYRPHPLQARGSRPQEGLPLSLPFSGTSTHKSDFPAYANARPSIPKFKFHEHIQSPEDRDFSTEGRTHFTPKERESCPAIPVAVSAKSSPGHVKVEYDAGSKTYRRKTQLW